MKKLQLFTQGIFSKNPVFFLVLGLCPTLAVTTSLENGIGMGLSALFVLTFSNAFISIIKGYIPEKIRIPIQIVIIATFVTIISMLMEAYFPDIFRRLGIYVPLIVVNCIILARADSFARKNPVNDSILDGIGMGIGFTLALMVIGMIREILGTAQIAILGSTIISLPFEKMMIMILPPGALLTIGLILAGINYFKIRGEPGE